MEHDDRRGGGKWRLPRTQGALEVEFKAICSVASGGTAVIGGKEIVAPSFDRLITVKIRDGKSEMRRPPSNWIR